MYVWIKKNNANTFILKYIMAPKLDTVSTYSIPVKKGNF